MSAWWDAPDMSGDVGQALDHWSESRHQVWFEQMSYLMRALNTSWNALERVRRRADIEGATSDTAAFKVLVLESMSAAQLRPFCETQAVADMVGLDPPVLNHETLRRDPAYRARQQIPAALEREAAKDHRSLKKAFAAWRTAPLEDNAVAAVKKLCVLLYVIRSNMAHGEKFMSDRDQEVCRPAIQVVEHVLSAIFAHPDTRLATYGSLMPGGSNHTQLDAAAGVWSRGTVVGRTDLMNGLPAFRPDRTGEHIEVAVLESPKLPALYPRLDDFEGPYFIRAFVPVFTANGTLIPATIYRLAVERVEHAAAYGRRVDREIVD